jgi:hypothetical protein
VLGEHRRDLQQAVADEVARLLDLLLVVALERVDVDEQLLLEPVQEQPRARITGSAGISCGCGKRSSMYSLMMFDSCKTRSRSTSTGTWLYGFITARSSGLWSRSTSMIWKSIPFSCSTMRQRWLKGSVVPE